MDQRKKYAGAIDIISNTPLMTDVYSLRFTCPGIKRIEPGQFILLDCLSVDNRQRVNEDKRFSDHSLLKRPFSIYQAYYRYFPPDYYSKIQLPSDKSSLVRLPLPYEFEIIYKVKEGGTGTRELTTLTSHDRAAVLGPLGKPIPIKKICPPDAHVCLVGGGIGIAPLNFLAQSLRICHYRVKVFMGTKTMNEYARHCILNLTTLNIAPEDLYVATEDGGREEALPAHNQSRGTAADIFHRFCDSGCSAPMRVFTCGPSAMMKQIHTICANYTIPCYAFVEERMACGIGVCLSCTIGSHLVCMDGPCFESTQIYGNGDL
ncbi:MAG: hypothetical protein ACMUJM_03495 [bacterium]